MSITRIDPSSRRALCFTPMESDRRLIVESAELAERLGYECVIVPEGWGLDSGIVLTEIALRTDRIRLVAGIQSVWGRTAAQLAMEATTIAEVSGGRFTLGLGASTPELASGLHGAAYVRPAARLADTLGSVRTLLRGDRVASADGRPGLRLGTPPRHHVPIWVAGLGPRTVALAAREADGWFPAFMPTNAIADVRRRFADIGTRCDVIVGPVASVATDPEVAARDVRQLVGWYLTGMGRLYGDRLAEAGFARQIAQLRLANPRPRVGRIIWPDGIDDLLDEVAIHGDHASVARRLAPWDGRADIVVVTPPPGAGERIFELIEAAAPRVSTAAPAG